MFNESARLAHTVPSLVALADQPEVEVLVVDDGSTDDSFQLLAEFGGHPRLHVIRQPRNRGKGAAVRRGVQESRGHTIVFMDADLATDLRSLTPLLAALDHADVAIGSRAHADSVLHDTTLQRSRRGGRFNTMVRRLTGLPFRDTQCGFKAFTAPAAKSLFTLGRVDGFAFDVEVLMLAQAHGMRIAEVPVEWTERPGSKVRPVRDPVAMAADVLGASVSSRRRRRRVIVPTIELSTEPGCVPSLAAEVHRNVRAGDLVACDSSRVHVCLPFSAHPDAVAARLRALPAVRAIATDVSLSTHPLSDLLMLERVPTAGAVRSVARAVPGAWTARLSAGA